MKQIERSPAGIKASDVLSGRYVSPTGSVHRPARTGQDESSLPRVPRTNRSKMTDKPTKASKSKWRIIPFGQNDHTTEMFHPKKIPQRLMRKYANWEQTPGGILVSFQIFFPIFFYKHVIFRTNWLNFWDGKLNTKEWMHGLLNAQDLRIVSNLARVQRTGPYGSSATVRPHIFENLKEYCRKTKRYVWHSDLHPL